MPSRLRRNRWFAALLVFASPAIGGQVMPILHPCPMHMAMMSMDMSGPMQSMPGHHDQAPGDQQQHHCDCTCIGCCHIVPAPARARPAIVARIILSPRHANRPVIEAVASHAAVLDRLPETTAPPLG